MKNIFLFISVLISPFIHAQIANPSFENWSGSSPTGWITNEGIYSGVAQQSSDAHAGSSAVRLNVVQSGSVTAGGTLSTDNSGSGYYPISAVPVALHGWCIANIAGTGDRLAISSNVTINGVSQSFFLNYVNQSSAVYKEFVYTFPTTAASGADSFDLAFIVGNQTATLNTSTYFIVDDLSFGSASGIDDLNSSATLEACSPNPATTTANIIYSISNACAVEVGLYDVLGHRVRTLLESTEQESGRYKIPVDLSELQNGVYIYQLIANGQSYTRKLVVSK